MKNALNLKLGIGIGLRPICQFSTMDVHYHNCDEVVQTNKRVKYS